jgi:hypothetical protein
VTIDGRLIRRYGLNWTVILGTAGAYVLITAAVVIRFASTRTSVLAVRYSPSR